MKTVSFRIPFTKDKFLYGLLVVCGLYIVLSSYDLTLPGANYDEMLYQAPAVNFLVDSVRTEAMQINPSVVHVFGRPLPLMLMTYIGSIKTLWHIVVFYFTGISVETARMGSVFLGVFALIYTFFFIRGLINSKTALLTAILMAVSAEYVFYTSRDMTIVFMVLAKMGALYHFLRYKRSRQPIHLITGCLWLGLGLYDKTSFLWFLFAFLLYLVILQRKELFSVPIHHWIAGVSAFVAGSIVFLIFNFIRLGETFRPLITDFTHTTGGINNLNIPQNMAIRIEQLFSLLGGEGIYTLFIGESSDSLWLHFAAIAMTLLMFFAFLFSFFQRFAEYRAKTGFILFFIFIPFLQTLFTPTSLSLHHVAIIWPFHGVLIAFFFSVLLPEWLSRFRMIKKLPAILFLSLIWAHLMTIVTIYGDLKNKGSDGNWSETIYTLNDYLIQSQKTVNLMTWGFTNNLIVTSRGQLPMRRLYRDLMKADSSERAHIIENAVRENDWYLFSLNQIEYTEYFGLLDSACQKKNFHLLPVKSFYQKNGKEIYRIYEIFSHNRHFHITDNKESNLN